MGVTFSQFFTPDPTLTEANLPSQDEKVVIITGASSGISHECANFLYHKGAKVHILGRSESDAQQSIQKIKVNPPSSSSSSALPASGQLHFLYLMLEDLSAIKTTADAFSAKETKLDLIFNNAGVSLPPQSGMSEQRHELQLAVNCLGPLILTELLFPTISTASSQLPLAIVRVVWSSSEMVDFGAPQGGLDHTTLDTLNVSQSNKYTRSKVGYWFIASQL